MKIFAACLVLMFTAVPAYAGDCKSWSAAMQEDEGGPVMTAEICAPKGAGENLLFVTCGAEGDLALRYIPVAPKDYPPNDGDYSSDFEVSAGQERFTATARYEDMDGAMAMSIKRDSFVSAAGANAELMVMDLGGKAPDATFTLKGAKKALEKLVKTCN